MLGARLVRFAVVTASSLGGQRMTAMIQLLNVSFFVSLGWATVGGPVEITVWRTSRCRSL